MGAARRSGSFARGGAAALVVCALGAHACGAGTGGATGSLSRALAPGASGAATVAPGRVDAVWPPIPSVAEHTALRSQDVASDTTALAAPPVPEAPPVAPPPPTSAPPPSEPRSPDAPVVHRPPDRPDREGSGTPPAPPPPGSRAVHPADFPDPHVFRAGAHWYAVSTQSGLTSVPILRSLDLRTWEGRGDALARLPDWAAWGHAWAPSVMATPTGFALLYTTRHRDTSLQCISRAVSVLPGGPYVDTSTEPLVCQWERGGSIDPTPFTDADGARWLLWKSEGTAEGEPTRIWSQRFDPSLEHLMDRPNELLVTGEPWEGPIVEGPSMVLDGGRHHLLYSGNRWETSRYATGHAVCDGPGGPCRRTSPRPVLGSSLSEAGPGGGAAFRDLDGSLRLAYHAWEPSAVAYPGGARRLHLARLSFEGDRAILTRGP